MELGELSSEVHMFLQEAERCGDLYAVVNLHLNHTNAAWLYADRPEEAGREATIGVDVEKLPSRDHMAQHYYFLLAITQVDL
ncbi:hypothetical protein BCY86_00850 [Pajaroellobacter abortibovis]|uniref:Uncharacterized protein n=1 Tax=Pajaroellobacter abortibovis TaxID=1882918 RepID=A0A1L6MV95_9BACT|nr:hypothetical protein BCY86_00850 [Pajaroellobacter abortibovis]